jgi:hypothetical protein
MAAVAINAPQLDTGAVVYVCYGNNEFHERLILGNRVGNTYLICTPDYDIYPEVLDNTNPDIESIRIPGVAGQLAVYGFGVLTAATRAQILDEGSRLLAIERGARGLGCGGGVGGAIVPVAAAALPVPRAAAFGTPAPLSAAAPALAPAAAVVTVAISSAPRIAGPGGAWILDEPLVGAQVGDEYILPAGDRWWARELSSPSETRSRCSGRFQQAATSPSTSRSARTFSLTTPGLWLAEAWT